MSLYKFNSNQVNKYAGYSRFYLKKRGFRGVCRNSSQSVGEIRNQQLSHSLLAIARADQSLEVGYAYSPYGQTQKVGVENQQAGSENNSQYTGRENDGNGLYYYRARYYDPVLKRFISEDPIGLAGGINKFAYVEGDPISLVDPEGRMGVVSVLAMLGGTGWATYQGYLAGQQFGVAQCKSNRTFDEREQSENWKPAQKLARASDQLNNLIATGGPIAARVGVGIAVAGAGGKFLGTATAFGGASLGFYLGQKDCKCP